MTDLLAELHYTIGLLDVTIGMMDKARESWASELGPIKTDAELLQGKFEERELVLIVRSRAGVDWNIRDAGEHDLQLLADDPRGIPRNAKVWELDLGEFHYLRAFRTGIAELATDLPAFFHGMTLVHAWGIFEHYLGSLLLLILTTRPEILGQDKQIKIADVFGHPSKEALLATIAEREVHELFYKPAKDWLRSLRRRYGLRQLTDQFDNDIIETALIRNCVVHNRSIVDGKLARHPGCGRVEGSQIDMPREFVGRATNILRNFASAVDKAAIEAHFENPTS